MTDDELEAILDPDVELELDATGTPDPGIDVEHVTHAPVVDSPYPPPGPVTNDDGTITRAL